MPFSRKYADTTDKIYDALQKTQGRSGFFNSVSKGNFRVVRKLIKAGITLNAQEPTGGETLIYAAILSKNVQLIQELIDAGANVNLKITKPATPLTYAIVEGVFDVVKVLVDNGADIFARIYSNEWTALHVAAHHGHVKISKHLIECGLDVDVRTKNNETPLHFAAKAGKTEAVQLFLRKGADISATCTDETKFGSNITPIFWAVYWGRVDTVDILIKAGADVNVKTSKNLTTLLFAAHYGPVKLVNMLLKAGAGANISLRSNHEGYTPLLLAAKSGHVDIVKVLLTVTGIEVDTEAEAEGTPLAWAISNGHLEVVKLLITNGAAINGLISHRVPPLHTALALEKYDVAEFFIEHGADIHAVNGDNATPLHVACQRVSVNIAKSLVERGANVNAKMKNDITPLHIAADADCLEIVKFLVDHGADCNLASSENDWTPLYFAAGRGNVKTFAYLVTKVSDTELKSFGRFSLLHLVAEEGFQELAEILLKKGVDVNAQDNLKCTPLHMSVRKGRLETADLLLKYGALLNLKAEENECTPLFLAVENEREKLVSLLLDKGADVNAANKFGVLPIHVAVKAESIVIVTMLLAKGAYYNVKVEAENYSGSPVDLARKSGNAKLVVMFELIRKLFSAVIKSKTEQIELCVQAGTILNAREASGRTALHFAVRNYNASAVKALLSGGADIFLASNKGDLPLQIAIKKGCVTILEILLSHAKTLGFVKYNTLVNVKTMKNGGTVLHTAAEKRQIHIVQFLLRNGAFYNAKNDSGKMPLQLTSLNESIKSMLTSARKLFKAVKKKDGLKEVKDILEFDNSVVNAREADSGRTPLYWSILSGHADIALALLSSGADYSLVTNEGATPLHIAASKGNVEIVKVLLNLVKSDDEGKSNEFINAATTNGTVALHLALNVDIVKCLLQAGAMFDIHNGEEKTALELTQNVNVKVLLKITHLLFQDVAEDACIAIMLLRSLKMDEFKAVANTRNEEGQTLVQVALKNAQVNVASELLKKLSEIR